MALGAASPATATRKLAAELARLRKLRHAVGLGQQRRSFLHAWVMSCLSLLRASCWHLARNCEAQRMSATSELGRVGRSQAPAKGPNAAMPHHALPATLSV
eukprot:CAMPEP_0176233284 /NCGR_PEP_ID=MMETSP0121_2-20121125/25740_1 /TAXON_ID=160619 /ORGANISM="Kryptoperidinium foliaceum, Strain CCMP 1326" /LENGTH=100 /DNA_ID=CAMNT_0017572663 /DNA_START=200 /DNA_END=500 /DNA_ORIENTATION=+